ncbi:efflux RND transporter permease subunit [Paraferrimonas sp. SM1919]|uniref:efflux RND transporter permease subunit n=1 Tax=Paraferrimonas sp. SM1919 TaxID=2662263 RepID=UPI0013D4B2D8|nr:efflux RND transporter permease subunit [Paraferrimonas sp. SM1919]
MPDTNKGLIAWFARNSVAANLLMLIIIIGGLVSANGIRKQFFPQVEINWIQFSAQYPGAAPQEVEEGITMKVEEALESIQGLQRVITYSNRNQSTGWIRVEDSYDPQVVLEEIKAEIDGINSFPEDMERPKVKREKMRQEVFYLSLYGDLSYKELKDLGQTIHDEIQQLPKVTISNFYGGLNYEIAIEVSKDKLRQYNLSFNDVSRAVRGYSRNMSAGQIRAENGYINLRVENQAYIGDEFRRLPLLTFENGSKLLLGDVATVKDDFAEGIQYSKFNGQNSVNFFVGAAPDQSITDIADIIKAFVKEKQKQLPKGVSFEPWVDMTYYLEDRLDLMLDSMKTGALLVFLMLAIFLRIRLAFWVMMGLPVCFLGTLLLMPVGMIDVTINVISLFGFILVLGIVVDDAIVMGESSHQETERHGQNIDNVIKGVKKVAVPATFGVLTTIAAFLPLILQSGPSAAFGQAIGFVVVLCLLFSLIESKLILPAHLAHMAAPTPIKENPTSLMDRLRKVINTVQMSVQNGLTNFIDNKYQPFMVKGIKYRYTIIMSFLGLLIIASGMFMGGFVKNVGTPKIPHDFPRINIEMNVDASEQATLEAVKTIEAAMYRVDARLQQQFGQPMMADVQVRLNGRTQAEVMTKLVDPDLRPVTPFELSDLWRDEIPDIPGLKSFTIKDSLFGGGRDDGDISFRLKSKDETQLLAAASELKAKLNSLKGVSDVNDSRQSSAKEVQFTLKPLADALGLTLADIASQVGNSFYGLEAQRLIRNGEEIKVMLRYPEEQRNSVADVSKVLIRTSQGAEIPLSELANIELIDGISSIRRENGNRTINIWASVDNEQAQPFAIAADIKNNFIPELLLSYPKVSSELSGSIQEQLDAQAEQNTFFVIALLVIFTLLAIPLKSYLQPLIIMLVIPFGIIGSIIGHMVFQYDLSDLSMFGIIAAAGVVVNDSLVMVDYINQARARGVAVKHAVVEAGCKRFRAILLTSLTTFIGLMPIMAETSMQAQMLKPMAISLSFGVLFATVVTLLLTPCLYVMVEELKQSSYRYFKMAKNIVVSDHQHSA